jgi:prolipoprotein diacylglyceryltransferase
VLPLAHAFPVIELSFSPVVTVAGLDARLDTLALAVVILACLVVAARIARRTPIDVDRSLDDLGPDGADPNRLRADDLLYVAVAALPGAVIGGRLGYALVHLDYYGANSSALLDITQGSLSLSLAVVGGVLTASIVAGLLGAPVGRWMHALVLPLLLALAGGKLAMALGGSGQGLPWDGDWATAYLGPGPWGSLAPALPSYPSQVYEALATVGVLLVMLCLIAVGLFSRRTGAAFLLGIALWAGARAAVASTWRDPLVLGPLRMEQVVCLAIAGVCLVLMAVFTAMDAARRRRGSKGVAGAGGEESKPGVGGEGITAGAVDAVGEASAADAVGAGRPAIDEPTWPEEDDLRPAVEAPTWREADDLRRSVDEPAWPEADDLRRS